MSEITDAEVLEITNVASENKEDDDDDDDEGVLDKVNLK
jgi:hypothetical protein